MPFIKKILAEDGEIGIWKITESPDELLSNFYFSEIEKTEYSKISATKRQTEYLVIRLLLQNLFQSKIEIRYYDSGRPFLPECALHLSISHSSNLVVVFVSEKKCGIDAETTCRNIDRVADRFLHHTEAKKIETSPNRQQSKILYWSAKEAIFKCSFEANIDFKSQIKIFPFLPGFEFIFKGILKTKTKTEHFALRYFWFENNIVVYCVEE